MWPVQLWLLTRTHTRSVEFARILTTASRNAYATLLLVTLAREIGSNRVTAVVDGGFPKKKGRFAKARHVRLTVIGIPQFSHDSFSRALH